MLPCHRAGEYVFDHSWANVYARMGKQYYPKLQSCVPFTPVPGNRLLLRQGPQQTAVRQALTEALKELTGVTMLGMLSEAICLPQPWARQTCMCMRLDAQVVEGSKSTAAPA